MSLPSRLVSSVESSSALDDVASTLRRAVEPLTARPLMRDALTGRWLGHSVHPMVVALPMGCWIAASVLDVTRGPATAARRLVGVGTITALPAVATGAADWLDTSGAEQRVGVAHAIANDAAVTLFAGSWLARRSGRSTVGRVLSFLGLGAVGVAGYLGGHLAYGRGVGVSTTAFQSGPEEWTRVVRHDDLPLDAPAAVSLDGLALVAVRRTDRVDVLEDRCTHRGGPLSGGTLVDGCVECPWHASRFDTVDGTVLAGPASIPQPAYDTRVVDGWIEIRRAEPGGLRRNPTGAAHGGG